MRGLLLLCLLTMCIPFGVEPTGGANGSPGQPSYVEHLIVSFNQTFTDLSYNVTAVPQCESDGIGIGYLLNGLSSLGYWYQVGLSWKWLILTNSSSYPTRPGFDAIFEVFSSNGSSFLIGGRGPLLHSVMVNPGDSVLLRIKFLSGNVSLTLHDWNTNISAETSYKAFGATAFVSSGLYPSDRHGFFTGLMTEQYHSRPYYGDEKQTTYSTSGVGVSSGWMKIDEFHIPYSGSSEFSNYSRVSYSNPMQTLNFTRNGAFESSNANQFITGGAVSGFECSQFLSPLDLVNYWYIIPIVVTVIAVVIAITLLRWRRSLTSPYFQATPSSQNQNPPSG